MKSTGRERYVFFSFPHIAIDAAGNVGAISRPGRSGTSCACGALAKALGEFKAEGYTCHCKIPGVHDALDPEYSILKQRLARSVSLLPSSPPKAPERPMSIWHACRTDFSKNHSAISLLPNKCVFLF